MRGHFPVFFGVPLRRTLKAIGTLISATLPAMKLEFVDL